MESLIIFALLVWGVIVIVKKFSSQPAGGKSKVAPPPMPAGSSAKGHRRMRSNNEDATAYMESPAEEICGRAAAAMENDPTRAMALMRQALEIDPSCFFAHLEIAQACGTLLHDLSGVAIDRGSLSWTSAELAERFRALVAEGLEHGKKADSLAKGQHEMRELMALLHTYAATTGRMDRDYNKAFHHNRERLFLETGHDEISDRAIEGIFADAHYAGRTKEMIDTFYKLAGENPAWAPALPRIKRLVGL